MGVAKPWEALFEAFLRCLLRGDVDASAESRECPVCTKVIFLPFSLAPVLPEMWGLAAHMKSALVAVSLHVTAGRGHSGTADYPCNSVVWAGFVIPCLHSSHLWLPLLRIDALGSCAGFCLPRFL